MSTSTNSADASIQRFDALAPQHTEDATLTFSTPEHHLTGAAFTAFRRHVSKCPGWRARRVEATPAERVTHGCTGKSKRFFVQLVFSAASQEQQRRKDETPLAPKRAAAGPPSAPPKQARLAPAPAPLRKQQRFKFNDKANGIEGSFWLGNITASAEEQERLPAAKLSTSPFGAGTSIVASVAGEGALQIALHRPQLPPLHMTSADGEAAALMTERGGYATLNGPAHGDGNGGAQVVSWRLYCVIAADTDDAAAADDDDAGEAPAGGNAVLIRPWVDQRRSFGALLMVTHPRLGAASPLRGIGQDVLKCIGSFVKLAPVDWAALERRVRENRQHQAVVLVEGAKIYRDVYKPKLLVEQYKLFLDAKIAHCDWDSKKISPPMLPDVQTHTAIIDQVWHSHIEAPDYEEECRMLTGGHVLQHEPIMLSIALPRYETAYDWLSAQPGTTLDPSLWPHPAYVFDMIFGNSDDEFGDDGCC
jgi:hypothetical protein